MMQDREFTFGWDPKSSKRSSGLFSVLKWFGNKESVSAPSPDLVQSPSSSLDSIESVFSTDTVASFAFVSPSSYKPFGAAQQAEKFILPGPETSTYRARLAQREASLESDRNLTLRSKYNLYKDPEPDRGHSLPLMSKSIVVEQSGMHRRTASESSKHRRAGAYCHVKGKRKAPQPPGGGVKGDNTLRRKKRLAPQPPNVICNDSLKLDHGILKPAKETTSKTVQVQEVVQVSPRPWYKRTLSKSATPEKKQPDQEKRKSGLSFLTNISELDKEAMEIISKENLKMKYLKNASQAPAFMRPKGNEHIRTNSDSWISPKRKSARDLIAKFNAITGVSRASKEHTPPVEEPKHEVIIPVVQEITPCSSQDKKDVPRTTAVVKPISRTQWNCPKCTLENDYWRIICRVCSTIKPYFDDFTSISTAANPLIETKTNSEENKIEKKDCNDLFGLGSVEGRISDLQRSVFQSHYPRLSQNYNCFGTEPEKIQIVDVSKFALNDNKFDSAETKQPQYPRISLNLNSDKVTENNTSAANNSKKNVDKESEEKVTNEKQEDAQKIEKIILGDEIGFTEPKKQPEPESENSSETKPKVEKMILGDEISVEKPDYVNVNKYEKVEPTPINNANNSRKIEKMILGDEISVTNSSQNHKITTENTTTKPKQTDEEKQATAKKEEREKLKKMLIEMKNSLPKRIQKPDNETKHRVSLIQEQTEPETEDENEKTAEIIVATTETVYENVKVKHANADKPVKVSSSAQTNAVLKRNVTPEETSSIQDAKGFHLIGAKDFVGISNEKTANADVAGAHTYANLNVAEAKSKVPDMLVGCSATDTLEINRLLRRLETAIAGGELGQAAVFARDLAQLKVPLSVIRHKQEQGRDKHNNNTAQSFNVDMYVEDKQSHRGPFPLQVTAATTVAELKQLVEQQYKIPHGVQRWILGKQLAADDAATLHTHQVTTAGCPVFLYLVAPANDAKPESNALEIVEVPEHEPARPAPPPNTVYNVPIAIIDEESSGDEEAPEDDVHDAPGGDDVQELWKCRACTLLNPVASDKCEVCGLIRDEEQPTANQTYLQLVNLDNEDLVRNVDAFECLVCLAECPPGEGVTLRECLHQFCRVCLAHTVEFSSEAEVRCPYRDAQYSCSLALQEREVKALVAAPVYEQHLAKSVQQAETRAGADAFHCKTPDCAGWCVYEDNVNTFLCPVCTRNNCLTCQAIHTGMNCKQYQEQMRSQSETDEEARRTRDFLADMMSRGEALACPTCAVVLLKKWGCDWLRCSMCKTEICWVTRGPRWGPAGKGDTSAGCRCGVNGAKCHPNCNYCH